MSHDSNTTLAEIVDANPGAARILEHHQLDYCCGGRQTLAQACDERRLDPAAIIAAIEAQYAPGSMAVDHTDGLSVEFADWRFNLRMSNTEPVIRLNVESRADVGLMQQKTKELLDKIRN